MLIPLPPKSHQRRMRLKPAPSAPPPAALTVIQVDFVEFDADILRLDVTVDTTEPNPLEAATGADPAKWSARYDPGTGALGFVGIGVETLDYQKVRVTFSLTEPEAGANEVSYSNAPSDIFDTLGRYLAAFSGFPFSG